MPDGAPLEGRAIVVTGSGGGLGRAYALGAARAGASVVVNDIRADGAAQTAAQIRALGSEAVVSDHDVRAPREAGELIRTCTHSFGRLDGLINNAGVYYESAPWEDDPDRIKQIVETNLLGGMYCGVEAIRVMRAQGSGSLVNIASGACFGYRNIAAYGATKGAIVSLTYSWAVDLREEGVRVNAVAPVAVTGMTTMTEQARRVVSRARTPDAIEPLVTFLLSGLSRGITGQFFHFDGTTLDVLAAGWLDRPQGIRRDSWDLQDLSRELGSPGALRPFGVVPRIPDLQLRAPGEPASLGERLTGS